MSRGCSTLREAQPFDVYASRRVLEALRANSIFDILAPDLVARRELPLGRTATDRRRGRRPRARGRGFRGAGQDRALSRGRERRGISARERATRSGCASSRPRPATSFFYIPGCAAIDEPLAPSACSGAELVFFDGTLWHEDEMIEQGLMPKTGSRMGHINMSGPDGSIAAFAELERRAQDLRPHQQFQPGAGRELARARGGARRRAGRSARTAWGLRYERTDPSIRRRAMDARRIRGRDPRGRRRALSRQASVP